MRKVKITCWPGVALGLPLVFISSYAQVVTIPGQPGAGRSPQQIKQVLSNTHKLQVTLQMDRSEYFPGEDAIISISVTNPGPAAMEVLEPFNANTGEVRLNVHDPTQPKTDRRSWRRTDPDESGELGVWDPSAPTVWLQPNQPSVKVFTISDPSTRYILNSDGRRSSTICGICITPEEEGDYRFCYNYGPGACAEFSVVGPTLEQ